MPARAAFLVAGLAAAFLLPGVAALAGPVPDPATAVGVASSALTDASAAPAALAPAVVEGVVADLPAVAPVSLHAEATARVAVEDPGAGHATPAAASAPHAAGQPSVGARSAAAAVPTAGATVAAILLASLAFGVDAVRAAQARVSAHLGRLGRGVLGMLAALPLFSRIERGNLMDNAVRVRVHEAVTQDPGLSLSDVRARTGIAWGTAVHHLRRLEQHGMVVSVNQLAHRRFFASNTPAAGQRNAVAVVVHPTARRIAHLVNQRPGIDQTGICQALGLKNPAASKHLRHFEDEGLVRSQRDGRKRLYSPTDALGSALRVLEPPSPAVRMAPALQMSPVAAGAW